MRCGGGRERLFTPPIFKKFMTEKHEKAQTRAFGIWNNTTVEITAY